MRFNNVIIKRLIEYFLYLPPEETLLDLREIITKKGGSSMTESKLYVGNLKYSVTNEELQELFAGYGEVKNVNIIEGKGFGFVEMSSAEEAQKAKDSLNNTDFVGRPLKIDEARPRKPRSEYHNRY